MRAISITRRKRQRGNSLVEFALFSFVLLLLTIGVVDMGRIFNMGNTAMNAAEYAAKWGALSPAHYSATTEIYNRAMENMAGYAGATATTSTTCRCGNETGYPIDCADECPNTRALRKKTLVRVETTIPFRSLSGLPWIPVPTIRGKFVGEY